MRLGYLGVLATMALACLLAWFIASDPGYIHIRFGDWRLEANMLVFSLAMLLFISLAYVLLSMLRRTLGLGAGLKSWLGHRSERRASKKTDAGLLAFLEGNWGEAGRLLRASAQNAPTPIVNYLAAAHAANEQGDAKEAETMLQKAYEQTEDSEFAIGIAKAQLELDQNQLESCLATLIRLKTLKPHHPFVLKLMRSVYTRLEDWRQLLHLMPELKKLPGVDKERLKDLEEDAWHKLFGQKGDELERLHNEVAAPEALAELWKQLPDNLQFKAEIIRAYAGQLIRLGCEVEAEALLRKMLSKNWSDRLIEQYGFVAGNDLSEQLIQAENWLKERPNNADLLLCLGRIAMRKELWGKAHEYFIASIQLKQSKEAFAELCRLERHMQHTANPQHLEGLLATLDLPKVPLPKP